MKKESAELIEVAVSQEIRESLINQSERIANLAHSIEKLIDSHESRTIYLNAGNKRNEELWHIRHDLRIRVRTLWQESWKIKEAAYNL